MKAHTDSAWWFVLLVCPWFWEKIIFLVSVLSVSLKIIFHSLLLFHGKGRSVCYYRNSTVPNLYFSYYCSGVSEKINQPVYKQSMCLSLKKLSTTDERVCFIKQIILNQFPYYIIAHPSLSKITETLSMLYIDICSNCWQVLKCAQALLLLLNIAVNGRVFLLSSTSLRYLFSFETLQHCHHQSLKMPLWLQNLFLSSILSQPFPPHYSTNPNPFFLLSPFCLFAQSDEF